MFGEPFLSGNRADQGISHIPYKQIFNIRILLDGPFVGLQ